MNLRRWVLIIIFGRFIAYDWYKCDKLPSDSFLYTSQECEHLYEGMDEAPDHPENRGDLESGGLCRRHVRFLVDGDVAFAS